MAVVMGLVGVAVGVRSGGVCHVTAGDGAGAAGAAAGGAAVTVRIVCPAGRCDWLGARVIYHGLMCAGHMLCSCPSLQFRAVVEDHLGCGTPGGCCVVSKRQTT